MTSEERARIAHAQADSALDALRTRRLRTLAAEPELAKLPLDVQIDVLARDAQVQEIQRQSRELWLAALNNETTRLLERSLFTVAAPARSRQHDGHRPSCNNAMPLWCVPPRLQAKIMVGERVLLPTDQLATIVCVSKFNRVVVEDDDGFTHYIHKERLRPTDINQRLSLLLPLLQRSQRRAASRCPGAQVQVAAAPSYNAAAAVPRQRGNSSAADAATAPAI